MKFVYADNSATTRVSDSVFNAMLPHLKDKFGNASSIYSIANEAKRAIENSREQIANALNSDIKEIFFTSCGTESNNWAIKGAAYAGFRKGKKHIISTNFEHHSVLHTFEYLGKNGFDVTFVPVNSDGLVSPADIKKALREDTALVSVMYANNEIGTIQPISEIGRICRDSNVLFHTDGVQALGNIHIDVKNQNIDLLSISGHKVKAPKGIGALYIRKGVVIDSIIHGGGQEKGKRAGTENTAFIVGLGQAVSDAVSDIDGKTEKISILRDMLIERLLKIPHCRLNGHREKRLCGNVNVSFEAIEGESLLLWLDRNGICASSGSACTSGSLDPSHVLLAIGLPHEIAHGSLRFSLNEDNTKEDVEYISDILPGIVKKLRDMSPVEAGIFL